MPYLSAAVVMVGILAIVNLVLSYGIIRRLRQHAAQLSTRSGADSIIAPAGTTVGAFATTTTEGERLTDSQLPADTLVGFFAPGCPPCRERLPEFVAHAATAGSRYHVLAVVVGRETSEATEYVAAIEPVGRVVVEPNLGAVATAFAVNGFPTWCRVDGNGRITATEFPLTLTRGVAPVPAGRQQLES
jgi:thiol-disulfide isomerase/thioredoxin